MKEEFLLPLSTCQLLRKCIVHLALIPNNSVYIIITLITHYRYEGRCTQVRLCEKVSACDRNVAVVALDGVRASEIRFGYTKCSREFCH